MTYYEQIKKQIQKVKVSPATPEGIVFDILNSRTGWIHEYKITQRFIATHLGVSSREARQFIRTLRMAYRVPIISDHTGYWIPRSEEEAKAYLHRIKNQWLSTASAWRRTYNSMCENLGIEMKIPEDQQKLFSLNTPQDGQ